MFSSCFCIFWVVSYCKRPHKDPYKTRHWPAVSGRPLQVATDHGHFVEAIAQGVPGAMGVPYGELVGGWPTPWKKGVRWVRQIGSSQLLGNIKNVPKHQPGRVFASQNLMLGCCGYDRLWARYFVKIVWCYVGSEQTICEVVLTGNKSMVRQGTEWYARTPGWLPGPCSWNPWRKRFNQRPLGKSWHSEFGGPVHWRSLCFADELPDLWLATAG